MNVLILTPDAVGSTLLQRTLTIYMQFHQFDRPVINLHELTNGLEKYYSPEFNQEIVSKKMVKNWEYYQSLEEIVKLLDSVDHYKTSRLAHYHLQRRNDSLTQQIPFYEYLNTNFYIIACRRDNVFEHALSHSLNKITKKLNVYTPYEKIETFYNLYKSKIEIDTSVFVRHLDAYQQYVNWSEQYFDIGSYFNYERDIPRLEQYIFSLPMFATQPNLVSWNENFGISFNDWNKMHYAISDVSALSLKPDNTLFLSNATTVSNYQQNAFIEWPSIQTEEDFNQLPINIRQEYFTKFDNTLGIFFDLDKSTQNKLNQLKNGYIKAHNTINQMIDLGIIISGPPIKKQTLAEKKMIIKNFNECVEIYNNWADRNSNALPLLTENKISAIAQQETQFWNLTNSSDSMLPGMLPTQQ